MPRSLTTPTHSETFTERLDLSASPTEVLRRFRGRDRLVALIGSWSFGEALIAFEPSRTLHNLVDLDGPALRGSGVGGGWIGALGYQFGRTLEALGPIPERPFPQADLRFGYYECALRLTNGIWFLDSLAPLDPAKRADILAALNNPAEAEPYTLTPFTMRPTPDEHIGAVARVREHIFAGDIFQANLCARLESEFEGDPLDVFCAGIEQLKPAFGAFVSGPDGALASFSPELFLRRAGDSITTSPIKGTAPLTTDPHELTSSAKNRAENIMIVDLMRNDLGRICQPGSVRVPALTRLEKHSVWHLVSDVTGTLLPGTNDSDVLSATFPPGSVTGAPKIRAMQLINEIETTAREAYTGAIGLVSPVAGMELNVTIRTFEFATDAYGQQHVWLGVGGGIVADSDPHDELAECLHKARPLIDAIGGSLPLDEQSTGGGELVVHPQAPAPHANVDAGVFETLFVEDSVVFDLDAHIARLDTSTRALYGRSVTAGLAERARTATGSLTGTHRLNITAVPSDVGTQGPLDVQISTSARDPSPQSWTLVPRILPGGFGDHKWIDRALLASTGDHEPLLIDADGSLLETARANLFLVLDDGLHTPPLDGRILPGTMRRKVIERAHAAGIPVFQHRLTSEDLGNAHEVFATNALRGLIPVTACVGIGEWEIGPVHKLLSHESPMASESADAKAVHSRPHVLFIDNYDSFVFNLVQYAGELGAATTVIRNDAHAVAEVLDLLVSEGITHVIVSPGPGTPTDAGISEELIAAIAGKVPVLGVCLGHQAIVEVFGGTVGRSEYPVHGKPSLVHHDRSGVFQGLASPIVCGRYHSLVATELGNELVATAHTADGTVMAVQHRTLPIFGVQFHPESILTTHGHNMIESFIRLT